MRNGARHLGECTERELDVEQTAAVGFDDRRFSGQRLQCPQAGDEVLIHVGREEVCRRIGIEHVNPPQRRRRHFGIRHVQFVDQVVQTIGSQHRRMGRSHW